MKPPPGISQAAVREHRRVIAGLEARGQLLPEFQGAIDRYIRAYDMAERQRRTWIREHRPLRADYPQVHCNHPLVVAMQVTERDAAKYAAALGLDPASHAAAAGGAKRPPGGQKGRTVAVDRKVTPLRLASS